MSIYAKKPKSTFAPCPEGLWPAVCIDVVDKGMVMTDRYGPKHKIQIRWVADAEPRRKDGKPYMVTKKINLSMGKKSNLRPLIEMWRGRKFASDQEAYEFDLDKLIGAPCQLQVSQDQGDDGPYAFVQVVLKAGKERVIPPADYVREQDRPGYQAPEIPEEIEEVPVEPQYDEMQVTDDDIPF